MTNTHQYKKDMEALKPVVSHLPSWVNERHEGQIEIVQKICDLLWEKQRPAFTQSLINQAQADVERMRGILKEIRRKEGKDIDQWSETGKVVCYYLNTLITEKEAYIEALTKEM